MIIIACKFAFLIMMIACLINRFVNDGKPSKFFKEHKILGGCVSIASAIGCVSIFIP